MGRPSKLTPEIHNEIVAMIRGGAYPERAAEACGIGSTTYYTWMKKGGDAGARSPYKEFRADVKTAEARSEAASVTAIRAAGRKSWQAHAWYLERKYPDRWGRRDTSKLELSGPEGRPVEVEMSGREKLAAALAARTTDDAADDTTPED